MEGKTVARDPEDQKLPQIDEDKLPEPQGFDLRALDNNGESESYDGSYKDVGSRFMKQLGTWGVESRGQDLPSPTRTQNRSSIQQLVFCLVIMQPEHLIFLRGNRWSLGLRTNISSGSWCDSRRVAWFPVLVMYLVVLGIGGKHLTSVSEEVPLAPARSVLSYGATVAAFIISYAALMSDYTNYMRVDVASWKVFLFSYLGLLLPTASVQLIGAAFAASLPSNPSWQAGYEAAGAGGLVDAILAPSKGFGKFLTVLLALSVIANMGPTLYSFSISSQVVLPFSARVPRYAFSIAGTGILIPLAIVGSTRFEETLVDFLGLVGYWSSTFIAVVAVEHVVFRKSDWSAYDISHWNAPLWFTGPIAKTTGDIGFEVGLFLTGIVYVPLRALERRVFGR
ncbi:hypothetical protein RSAG8_00005, partial [Rhizoctonia solani AG-8 WAC10335]